MDLNVVIIGLGGIGSTLSEKVSQFLHYYHNGLSTNEDFTSEMGIVPPVYENINITLVDGDTYEVRNRQRQDFSQIGLKAEIKERDLMENYGSLSFRSISEYVTEENVADIIKENDIVLMCVDNHASRKIVNDHCKTLRSVTLISGGNGFHKAHVQRYIRKDGQDIRPNLTQYHPEIDDAEDHPNNLGCEELTHAAPQLVFANWGAAFHMGTAFYVEVILQNNTEISDQFTDLINGQTLSKKYRV